MKCRSLLDGPPIEDHIAIAPTGTTDLECDQCSVSWLSWWSWTPKPSQTPFLKKADWITLPALKQSQKCCYAKRRVVEQQQYQLIPTAQLNKENLTSSHLWYTPESNKQFLNDNHHTSIPAQQFVWYQTQTPLGIFLKGLSPFENSPGLSKTCQIGPLIIKLLMRETLL